MFYCEKCDTIYDIIQGDKKSEKTGGSDVNKKSKLEIDDALANEEKGGDISSSSEGEDTSDTDTKKESKHHRKAARLAGDESSSSEEEDGNSDSSDTDSSSEDEDKGKKTKRRRRMPANYDKIVSLVMEEKPYDHIELIGYEEKQLIKNASFHKLSSKNRELVLGAVQHMLPDNEKKLHGKDGMSSSRKLNFHCGNCGFQTSLKPGTEIFQESILDTAQKSQDLSKYRDMADDPTLPRTRNYTCPNEKCDTHKKPSLSEMVSIRVNNYNFSTVFVCCVCRSSWQ
jgi:hypothetical protein